MAAEVKTETKVDGAVSQSSAPISNASAEKMPSSERKQTSAEDDLKTRVEKLEKYNAEITKKYEAVLKTNDNLINSLTKKVDAEVKESDDPWVRIRADIVKNTYKYGNSVLIKGKDK